MELARTGQLKGIRTTMKILQVASFSGNIGDNANHIGFRSWFEPLLTTPVQWREFEIRRVFRGDAAFDDDFVELANDCDLVVMGGGNFFELWVTNSPSGTSISINNERLRRIRTPIFVNGVGVDIHQGVAAGNVERFRAFLQTLREIGAFITVRNDGALANLRGIGIDPAEYAIGELPDGGFFARFEPPQDSDDRVRIGVNLAGDMLERRFAQDSSASSYDAFIERMARLIAAVCDHHPQVCFVLFPHIFRDLVTYSDLLNVLPDRIRRGRVEVARYATGDAAANLLFSEYAQCALVLGMRFHANVVALANAVPVIGLNTYMQIENLYRQLGLTHQLVDVRTTDSEAQLYRLILQALDQGAPDERVAAALVGVTQQMHEVRSQVSKWLAPRSGQPR
jgi:polysaccharide pyruvyl transferase WcaK-like protein